jgi:3-hydroxyacyl-CoA dehydrogenase/enoyl-CoA hydratase/3-hydroxybutyryl-CoA epimerase/enoyl-CoA isomerase
MIFNGVALTVNRLPSGIASLVFDLQGSSVNKFNQQTLMELRDAVAAVADANPRGLLLSSGKSGFIVGADITEFTAMFQSSEEEILGWLRQANAIFNSIEDLPCPTVTAINGVALGGGMELAIAADYRVATADSRLGFPEVKLGIIPGFGGTVRMPRLVGADNANQWISSGQQVRAAKAFAEGAVDALVDGDMLLEAAEAIIEQCNDGKLDFRAVRRRKTSPLTLAGTELMVAFETAKALVAQQAGPHFPAPLTAVRTMQQAATLQRSEALEAEHAGFVKMAKSEVSGNLVQLFLNDQYLAGKAKKLIPQANQVRRAAVLGAGIMGGGIAYQSALSGTPIIMKDIAREGLDAGIAEAKKQFDKRVSRGRMTGDKMLDAMLSITPTLDYSNFDQVDVVIEAVVENPGIKKKVLAELEQVVAEDTVIATNTSTISVTSLAQALSRPQNFCGMHFFNPVPVMPLVEVIRGAHSSPAAIATVVAYARSLGKTPIVVNDCPGFLVNRILFPYFGAFAQLLRDGADFLLVDRVMEKFGWPMGPAYLLDVIGMDTGVHAQEVMAAGFPDRMQQDFTSAMDVMYQNQRLGQKTGSGFYRYEIDRRGKPRKQVDDQAQALIAGVRTGSNAIGEQEIVQRMMVAMCLETVRCLEDGIIDSPVEADMGLILGLGFPTFRGGALRYIDALGASEFCQMADRYGDLGPLYQPTDKLREMAAAGAKFYQLQG